MTRKSEYLSVVQRGIGMRYDIFQTELGWVGAVISEKGLRCLSLRPSPEQVLGELQPEVEQATYDPSALESVRQQLHAYFNGKIEALNELVVDTEDSPSFFRAAWEACRQIPPGETRSYAWLAAAAGRPGAFRAAGQAMARNRVALVIPCHRVIGSDGSLHGYGSGLNTKARLLELERQARFRR